MSLDVDRGTPADCPYPVRRRPQAFEAAAEHRDQRCTDYGVGLHHFAFEAPDRESVDVLRETVERLGAEIVDPPAKYDYVPGYYAVFFRDPDGMRLEYAYIRERFGVGLVVANGLPPMGGFPLLPRPLRWTSPTTSP